MTNPYQDRVETVKSLFGILPKDADLKDAIVSPIVDYEDAVVEKVALRKSMDYIVTKNIKDFQSGSVKVILPDDFIELMKDK